MTVPGLFAFGYPPPGPCLLPHFSWAGDGAEATPLPQVFYLHGRYPPHRFYKETSGPPQFPSHPFENMPWSQTPVVTCTLAIAHAGLLPSTKFSVSAFAPLSGTYPDGPQLYIFRGSIHSLCSRSVQLRTSVTGFARGLR